MTACMSRAARIRKRWILMWAQDCICAHCSRLMDPMLAKTNHPDFPTLDHVLTRSQQGSNRLDNLILKHRVCNELRGNAPPTLHDLAVLVMVQARIKAGAPTTGECQRLVGELAAKRRAA